MIGTEVDDEDYFSTLEKNTNLMILCGEQKWTQPAKSKSSSIKLVDATDNASKVSNPFSKDNQNKNSQLRLRSLVSSLHNEPGQIALLGGLELEKLSDMDPESLADIVSDRYDINLRLNINAHRKSIGIAEQPTCTAYTKLRNYL